MKYLLLVHYSEEAFSKIPKNTRNDMLAESIRLCHQLHGKGRYIHASPLQPEATGTVVRVKDGKPVMTDLDGRASKYDRRSSCNSKSR